MLILSGQTKGGVGKSVLAANLSVILAHKGRNVLLVDADKQQSSSKWGSIRTIEGHQPNIVVASARAEEASAKDFREKITALKERFDDIVIDCGGYDSRELRASLSIADVLISPVAPSIVDLWALREFDALVEQFLTINQNLRPYVVINKAPSLNFYNQLGQAKEALGGLLALKPTDIVITDRPRIQDCYQIGQGAYDLDSRNASVAKAQAEMLKIYELVMKNG